MLPSTRHLGVCLSKYFSSTALLHSGLEFRRGCRVTCAVWPRYHHAVSSRPHEHRKEYSRHAAMPNRAPLARFSDSEPSRAPWPCRHPGANSAPPDADGRCCGASQSSHLQQRRHGPALRAFSPSIAPRMQMSGRRHCPCRRHLHPPASWTCFLTWPSWRCLSGSSTGA